MQYEKNLLPKAAEDLSGKVATCIRFDANGDVRLATAKTQHARGILIGGANVGARVAAAWPGDFARIPIGSAFAVDDAITWDGDGVPVVAAKGERTIGVACSSGDAWAEGLIHIWPGVA